MKRFVFEAERTVDSVIHQLVSYGITVVPNFIEAPVLEPLRTAFFKILESDYACVKQKFGHPTNPEGRQATIDPCKAASDGFPQFEEVFRSEFMDQVANTYFAPYRYDLNSQVLLVHLLPCPVPILPWHFDRIQTLKFWIYLKDTTTDDGAFEYCPGTHWEGHYRAGYHMLSGTPLKHIPNDVPSHRIQNPVAVEAKAGDLVIFDPDGFHRGGIVGPGRERCVLRADTYPVPSRKYSDRPFTYGWWLSGPWNLARWLSPAGSRLIGDRVKDKAQRRDEHDITK
jgi:Phytanoyl-CoA dioxygenase (PhyH)